MAGIKSDLRRQAERKYKDALRSDPQGKNAATQTLKAAYDAALKEEDDAKGSSGQAKSWF